MQALLTTLLSAYAEGARANRAGYVSFADGLAAISQHAEALGYDGVILFLDELILWFLSRLRRHGVGQRGGVEALEAGRAG